MKFSSVFSAFLAALTVGVGASPVPTNDDAKKAQDLFPEPNLVPFSHSTVHTKLDRRNNPAKTAVYEQFEKIHSGLEVNKWYAFTVTWTKGDVPGDNEPKKEMAEVQKKYGFDHIAIVTGQVVEKSQGKGKPKKLDFSAQLNHLRGYAAKDGSVDTDFVHKNWVVKDSQDSGSQAKIAFFKETTSGKVSTAQTKAANQNKAEGKKWKAGDNDCKAIVDLMEKNL